jgi:copper homeostasis protein
VTPRLPAPRLEVCVDTPDGLAAAIAGGADRIELCAALDLGGLTPAPGLIAAARRAPVPVRAMIRPRAGGFVASPADLDAMSADLAAVRAAGLDGAVLGVATADGRLDRRALARLVAEAGPLKLTLHRVIDRSPDLEAALETAIALGFDTVLTSGGTPAAADGVAVIARLVARAGGRIAVMAGGGVTPTNAADLAAATAAPWLHASGRGPRTADPADIAFGFAAARPRDTDAATVAAIRAALGR